MAIVGGFLGGGVEMVPAGQMQVLLQWNTEDRQNISGTVFTLTKSDGTSGPYTVNGDASGRAEIIVPAGEYTIEVSHSGSYENDGPQKVIGESTQSYYVLFDAYFNRGASLFFKYTVTGATYTLTKDEGGTTYEGQVVAGVERIVAPGTYHIKIACGVHSWEDDIIITGDTVLSDYAVPVWDSDYPLLSITRDGMSIPTTDGLLLSDTAYTMVATLDGVWTDGIPVTCHYEVLANSLENSVIPEYTDVYITNTTGNLTIPFTGAYDFMAVGGGGGGGSAGGGNSSTSSGNRTSGGGGGSGLRSTQNEYNLSENQILYLSIGSGGAGGESGYRDYNAGSAGGSTVIRLGSSSGTVLRTGAGGSGGGAGGPYNGGNGGDGGAGGGGGYCHSSTYSSQGGNGQTSTGARPVPGPSGGGGGGANNFTFAGVRYGDTDDPTGSSGGRYGGGGGATRLSSGGSGGRFLSSSVLANSHCIGTISNPGYGGSGGGSTNGSYSDGSKGSAGAVLIALKVSP